MVLLSYWSCNLNVILHTFSTSADFFFKKTNIFSNSSRNNTISVKQFGPSSGGMYIRTWLWYVPKPFAKFMICIIKSADQNSTMFLKDNTSWNHSGARKMHFGTFIALHWIYKSDIFSVQSHYCNINIPFCILYFVSLKCCATFVWLIFILKYEQKIPTLKKTYKLGWHFTWLNLTFTSIPILYILTDFKNATFWKQLWFISRKKMQNAYFGCMFKSIHL